MKVLFAVNNEHISDSIIKKYQQDYKELISSKNVYYFNALLKELQEDKSYDRIVIGEDLEMFSNNNYDAMDKFIFDRLDKVSDEASNASGEDIPIILICTDRRNKADSILVKLFSIGIYSALIGQDRTITNVCKLINVPRTKKEAKIYYKIDTDDVDYKPENENDVSEVEIQNILMHYKRLGKNEEKYVDSFNSIAAQYTNEQLKIIAKFLPLNVKAVLEAECPKYQEVMMGTSFNQNSSTPRAVSAPSKTYSATPENYKAKIKSNTNTNTKFDNSKIDIIQKQLEKNKLTKPVIVPSAMNINNVTKIEQNPIDETDGFQDVNFNDSIKQTQNAGQPVGGGMVQEDDDPLASIKEELKGIIESEGDNTEENVEVPVQPKRRGRPRKNPEATNVLPGLDSETPSQPKKRGRPRKVQPIVENEENVQPTLQSDVDGYQNIVKSEKEEPIVNLFDLDDEEDNTDISNVAQGNGNNNNEETTILPGFEEVEEENNIESNNNINNLYNSTSNSNFNNDYNQNSAYNQSNGYNKGNISNYMNNANQSNQNTSIQSIQNTNIDLTRLLTADKKVVSFVGTSKNGTSFLVNNIAEIISQNGIKTAILDLTKNKNAYYIYTENEEDLRKIAFNCIDNLRRGNAQGINVHKNLDVYTTLPGENQDINDASNIMQTLISNYSLVILDCDFDTNIEYFRIAQELYLVQSYDVLTIQPLTAFLRDLKAKNILEPEKLKVVLNKVLRVKSITERTIIGGMAFYNDPAMSFMTELFNKDSIPYCVIPFEEQTYSKYLEGLVNCKITTNGYSKNFMSAISKLTSMVYPLIAKDAAKRINQPNAGYYANKTTTFNPNMNSTLDKMKKNL